MSSELDFFIDPKNSIFVRAKRSLSDEFFHVCVNRMYR
jgi:hypothetical protein